MTTITQDMRFRLSLIRYAEKHGVTKAARKYKTNRQYIYRWKNRYDGTWDSLRDRSRRPHHHPDQHTDQELKLIRDMRRRNPHAGLVVFWVKLRQRGYSRSITGLWRVLKRLQCLPVKPANPKYIPKPYEQMTHPGQRVQIDVKHVPAACIVGDAECPVRTIRLLENGETKRPQPETVVRLCVALSLRWRLGEALLVRCGWVLRAGVYEDEVLRYVLEHCTDMALAEVRALLQGWGIYLL